MECTKETELLESVKSFAQKRIAPVAGEVDETGIFPAETLKGLADLGVFGMLIPKEYGGCFSGHLLYYQVVRNLAKVCASHALTLLAHNMCCQAIVSYGSVEQKKRYLPILASGRELGCMCMTESDSGSDLSNIATSAHREDKEFLLNGSKCFITNGGIAQIFVVLAATSQGKGPFNKGLFLLEKNMAGIVIGRQENKMGVRGSDTRELFFEDVRVPGGNLLGRAGQGMLQISRIFETSRLATASMSLGMAQKGVEIARGYSRERRQFGKTIGHLGIIQNYLADMATGLECGRLLIESAALLQEKGIKIPKEAAMAKCYCSEMACDVLAKAMQILGGRGYMKEWSIERMLRDARLCTIIEGTNEIQRRTIAKYL